MPAKVYSQVQGISYTLSPYAEYNFFNENSGLKDGIMGGIQLGLGFGEYVELRGLYSTSLNGETDLTNFGFEPTEAQIADYIPLDLKFRRYGGEMKLNMSRGQFLPYFTIGTGIQSIGIDTMLSEKQIYVNVGAGIKISAGDRYTIGLQVNNTSYNYNALNNLMTLEQRELYGLSDLSLETDRLSNWAVRASLELYIGGRRPGEITAIDRAYLDNFSGGIQGLNIPLDANVSKINFHEDLPYRDAWFAGASLGLNFGPLVGVRGFYMKSFEDKVGSRFDELSLYGGEARFKLNEGKGLTPWITIGGGNINASPEYIGLSDTTLVPTNKGFAMGGIGIDLPFSKQINATAFVRNLLTTSNKIGDLSSPDQVVSSLNYGLSLNFSLGKKKKKISEVKQAAFDEYLLANNQDRALAAEKLKDQYENRIKELETQVEEAVSNQDAQTVKELTEEKSQAEVILSELNKNEPSSKVNPNNQKTNQVDQFQIQPSRSEIRMSPAEFQLLIREILDATKGGSSNNAQPVNPMPAQSQTDIASAISDYDKDRQIGSLTTSLNELKGQISEMAKIQNAMKDDNQEFVNEVSQFTRAAEDRIIKIENQLDKSSENLELIQKRQDEIEKGLKNKDVAIESFQSDQLNKELEFTNRRIEDLRAMMVQTLERMNNEVVTISKTNPSDTIIVANKEVSNRTIVKTANDYDNSNGVFSKFHYKGMSGFAGFSVGGSATLNLGYRLHYQIGSDTSKLEFMPESFFGFGSPSAFGITANLVYHLDNFTKSEFVNPYIGFGLGFMKVGNDDNVDKLTGALNFIVGTSLNVWSGDMYVDFTARNLFKYNQLIVGYRFPF